MYACSKFENYLNLCPTNETRQLKDISSIFTKSTLKKLIAAPGKGDHVDFLLKELSFSYFLPSKHYLLPEFFDLAYKKLITSYRSEYIYKNAIAEKIIKGKHRLSSNCYYSTEFRVHNSIADIVIANGTTTVYEIKTEFDSLERLDYQLENYTKVFDRIYVVIPESKYSSWSPKIAASAGVIVLTKKYTLQIRREPLSNVSGVELHSIFSCLRRNEIIEIIDQHFGEVPQVRPVSLKSACRELFLTLSKEDAHYYFLMALRKRGLQDGVNELIKRVPSLTSVFLTANLSKREIYNLRDIFDAA